MKKTAKIIGAALSAFVAIALVTSCDTGSNEEPKQSEDGAVDVVLEGISDWSIALGYQNVTTVPLTVSGASIDSHNAMRVSWASSLDFRSCELFAMLPASVDYGAYDGIQFDVRLPASSNFLLLLRNPSGGTTFKVWEDYVYRGTDTDGEYAWVTVKKPFADAVDTGWGPAADPADLQDWLTADFATQKQINLNPVLNVGGGSAVDTAQVTYFDNIGFYTIGSAGDGTDDTFTAVWDFEPAAN